MKAKAIVSDWNGTLIEDEDDGFALKQIAMDGLKRCARRPWLWGRAARLGLAKFELERLVEEYRNGFSEGRWNSENIDEQEGLLQSIYGLYNAAVINGMPVKDISVSCEKYGKNASKRLSESFEIFCKALWYGFPAGILTSAYDSVVQHVMWTQPLPGFFLVHGSRLDAVYEGDRWIGKGIALRNYADKVGGLKEMLSW